MGTAILTGTLSLLGTLRFLVNMATWAPEGVGAEPSRANKYPQGQHTEPVPGVQRWASPGTQKPQKSHTHPWSRQGLQPEPYTCFTERHSKTEMTAQGHTLHRCALTVVTAVTAIPAKRSTHPIAQTEAQ